MASHFSTIGLPVDSEADLHELANRIGPLAERFATRSGVYYRWADESGAEVWIQVNANNELLGLNPHFAGRSVVQVGLTSRIPSNGPSELDGSFHGWADPSGDEPETGCYPFVFDAPDYRLNDGLEPPVHVEVQIAAFAHEITLHQTVDACNASQTGEVKFASQSFIPSGLFSPGGDSPIPPQALAIFTGHVSASMKKVNSLTGRTFYWAAVETLGGNYDVLVDPSLIAGVPPVGGVLSGSFWLSGRILTR